MAEWESALSQAPIQLCIDKRLSIQHNTLPHWTPEIKLVLIATLIEITKDERPVLFIPIPVQPRPTADRRRRIQSDSPA